MTINEIHNQKLFFKLVDKQKRIHFCGIFFFHIVLPTSLLSLKIEINLFSK